METAIVVTVTELVVVALLPAVVRAVTEAGIVFGSVASVVLETDGDGGVFKVSVIPPLLLFADCCSVTLAAVAIEDAAAVTAATVVTADVVTAAPTDDAMVVATLTTGTETLLFSLVLVIVPPFRPTK